MPRSLAFTHRRIARQWHPYRNNGLTPADVTASSRRKVWWSCSHGPDHEWVASIDRRTHKGTGCPFCAGKRVSVTNSLATVCPELAAQWHETKNGELTPEDVVVGSNKRVWWRCPQGPDHEWSAHIVTRTAKGAGCPFCNGQKASSTNSLAARFPDVSRQWHPRRNGALPLCANVGETVARDEITVDATPTSDRAPA